MSSTAGRLTGPELRAMIDAAVASGAVMQQNAATYVSQPGGGQAIATPGAPGAGGPGAQMSMASAMVWLVGGAAAGTFVIGYLARRGVKPEIGRFDVVQVTFNALGVAVVFGTVKTLAYRFHGHKLSQAVLLLL